jgi:hypothetical protein
MDLILNHAQQIPPIRRILSKPVAVDRSTSTSGTRFAFLRGKGMRVLDKVDTGRYQAALAPGFADFERQFGKRNLDRIKAVE